ncbi:conserved protein of unknown function [Petrocella atlantisensis]|uniref:Uncharacterized protein n=1 Tax=Petrocella atlantisensis TaxID=2173034 RepID=A0A3P7RX38_9FIRM|nr:conserved protein of unknown function [Petrocella atlantisensis]
MKKQLRKKFLNTDLQIILLEVEDYLHVIKQLEKYNIKRGRIKS